MKRILIVDDSKEFRDVMVTWIKAKNSTLDVTTACNGQEALELLTSKEFDVILTDLQMPVMNGEEFAKKAREAGYRKPLYMWSADLPHRCIQCIDRFFVKGSREMRVLIEVLSTEAV